MLLMGAFIGTLLRATFQPGLTALEIYDAWFNLRVFSLIYLPLCLVAGLSLFDYRLVDYGRFGRKRVWFWQLFSQNLIMQGSLWGLWTVSLLVRSYTLGHWLAVQSVLWGCLQLGLHQGFLITLSLMVYWMSRRKILAVLSIWLLTVVNLDILRQPPSPFFRFVHLAPWGTEWFAAGLVFLGWGLAVVGLRWLIDWRDS